MKTVFLSICLALCCLASSAQNTPQSATPQPAGYANYSIMLVNPAGGGVVLMHTPQNALELVDVSKIKEALSAGYVPVRTAEFAEMIESLKTENIHLTEENKHLLEEQSKASSPTIASFYPSHPVVVLAPQTQQVVSPAPSQADIEAQRQAQAAADKANRRQQLIQAWMTMQQTNQPKTLNLNVRDCTRFPALCAGR